MRILLACCLASLAAQCPAGTPDVRVDRVFAQWDRSSSPGCALAVVHQGALVYSKGYGAANLELGVPITPQTVFDIGSVSKQFTAMSIVLLAEDGKLSLDDEIHKFIPELPEYGAPVTVRRMLHHLSGLRSYTDLFDLAGIPELHAPGSRPRGPRRKLLVAGCRKDRIESSKSRPIPGRCSPGTRPG